MGQAAVSQDIVSRTTTGITSLTSEVLLRLFQRAPNSNVFISAFSLSTALSMTAAGAKGDNLQQMLTALQFSQSGVKPEEIPGAFDQIMAKFEAVQSSGLAQLTTANHLWIEKRITLNQEFMDVSKKFFHAGAENCDFVGNAEQERQKINAWAEKETHNKIKDLLPPNSIKSDTSLILTNAIYFKANWIKAFDPKSTASKPFKLLSGKSVNVDMMIDRKASYRFTQQEEFKALEKPYKSPNGNNLSMVFVLPEEPGAAGLEAALKAIKPNRPNAPPFFMTQMFDTELRLEIPKFKFEFDFEASDLFQELGMKLAFTGGDFSGISSQPLIISKILHKAFVEVNEEGTEAAAATAVMMSRSMAVRNPIAFVADRPFVFLIWDRATQLVLFSGVVNNPAQ